MARIMAVDYGDARIGIALTDPLQIFAKGYKTLQNNKDLFQSILSICRSMNVESLVIGIPYDQESQIGISAKKVLVFANSLLNFFKINNYDLPFYEQDERYTTHEAMSTIREIKVKRKRKKAVIDQIAAANILSGFMNSREKSVLKLEYL